jgi:hypothetical protein
MSFFADRCGCTRRGGGGISARAIAASLCLLAYAILHTVYVTYVAAISFRHRFFVAQFRSLRLLCGAAIAAASSLLNHPRVQVSRAMQLSAAVQWAAAALLLAMVLNRLWWLGQNAGVSSA